MPDGLGTTRTLEGRVSHYVPEEYMLQQRSAVERDSRTRLQVLAISPPQRCGQKPESGGQTHTFANTTIRTTRLSIAKHRTISIDERILPAGGSRSPPL